MKIVWTRKALANVDSARDHIHAFNPTVAVKVSDRIETAAKRLCKHPFLGRPGRVLDTRELFISGTPFIVIYRIRGKTIQILRLLHERQRWP